MQTNIIDPTGLEADAVVPQCLDNQHVPDVLYAKMISESLDYTHPEIAMLRENNFRTEFIRSLIYSSQVVIQRAFFKGSDFLYKNFLPEDRYNFHAFGHLMREKAITPFLFRETSLEAEQAFGTRSEGVRATKALLEEQDKVTCVRLAVDEQANSRACDAMATTFGAGLARLEYLDDNQRNAMASELFRDRSRLDEPGLWQAFNEAVDGLVDYANGKNRQLRKQKLLLTRNDVYRDNFVVDGSESIENGRFRQSDRDRPFMLELKKYVDLIYNVNLPDHLKRYTFTPENMPSRMALQDAPGQGFRHEVVSKIVSDRDALEAIRRTFMAHTQKAMTLPLLRELTVADVREIRALPEWKKFIAAQSGILEHPTDCLARLDQFQADFDAFQSALSRWYNSRRQQKLTEARYCSYISLALSLGGKLLVAGSDLGAVERIAGSFAIDSSIGFLPEKIKNYSAKLMVNVYDIGARKLDADRSYSIELMHVSTDLAREDVVELLRSVNARSDDALPRVSGQMADQGVQ